MGTHKGTAERYLAAMKEMHSMDHFNALEMARVYSIGNGISMGLIKTGHIIREGTTKPHRHRWVGSEPTLKLAEKVLKMHCRQTMEYKRIARERAKQSTPKPEQSAAPLFTNTEPMPEPDLSKFYYIAGKYEIPAARLNEFMNDLKAIL